MSRLAARIGETTAGAGQELVASLDFPLPRTLAPGRGSALFACGWCVSRGAPVRELELVLDGEAIPAERTGHAARRRAGGALAGRRRPGAS